MLGFILSIIACVVTFECLYKICDLWLQIYYSTEMYYKLYVTNKPKKKERNWIE